MVKNGKGDQTDREKGEGCAIPHKGRIGDPALWGVNTPLLGGGGETKRTQQ